MMLAAAEAVGPQLVASLLYKRAAAHKNPKVTEGDCTTSMLGHFANSLAFLVGLC